MAICAMLKFIGETAVVVIALTCVVTGVAVTVMSWVWGIICCCWGGAADACSAPTKPPPPVTTREPEQLGERRVTVSKFAQLPILMMGYHVPEARHADFYPLKVLQTVLFSGQSSRMYQRIVERDQLAISINGTSDATFDPSLFMISAQPKDGVQPAAVEKAIDEELDRVRNELVTDQEIEKAKNILLAGFYRQMKTISGKANTLGTYEVFFGD